jgi:hypothetical protein
MQFDFRKGPFMRRARLFPLLLAAAAAGCSDSGGPNGPDTKPPGQLTIIPLPETASPIWNPVDSFYAKKGTDRELRIYFANSDGTGPGEEYMRLRVDAASLLTRPDGTPFQVGDSILIVARIPDPHLVQVEFEPTGLTFSPSVPAQLKIDYGETGGDLDDDGDVDAQDSTIVNVMAIWRQELPGDAYLKVGGVNVQELDEIQADITSFTRYAIAY